MNEHPYPFRMPHGIEVRDVDESELDDKQRRAFGLPPRKAPPHIQKGNADLVPALRDESHSAAARSRA